MPAEPGVVLDDSFTTPDRNSSVYGNIKTSHSLRWIMGLGRLGKAGGSKMGQGTPHGTAHAGPIARCRTPLRHSRCSRTYPLRSSQRKIERTVTTG